MRVKVRPDSSAAVYGYVCVFFIVYVCSRVRFAAPIQNRWRWGGGDGNEESQTETRQRDLSVGSEVSASSMRLGGTLRFWVEESD